MRCKSRAPGPSSPSRIAQPNHVAPNAHLDRRLRLSVSRVSRAAAVVQSRRRADGSDARRVQHGAPRAQGETRFRRLRRRCQRTDLPRRSLRRLQSAATANAGRPAYANRANAGAGRGTRTSHFARVQRRGRRRDRYARHASGECRYRRAGLHRRQGPGTTGQSAGALDQHHEQHDPGRTRCGGKIRRARRSDRRLPGIDGRCGRQHSRRAEVRTENRSEMAAGIRYTRRANRQCRQDRRQDRRESAHGAAATAAVAQVGDDQD